MSKQHSKQAKTREVERNYKMFANPVFINHVPTVSFARAAGQG